MSKRRQKFKQLRPLYCEKKYIVQDSPMSHLVHNVKGGRWAKCSIRGLNESESRN